jgi:hypothetical protein
MTALLLAIAIAIIMIMFSAMLYNAFYRLPKMMKKNKPAPMEFYLFKIARVTGNSEYDIFCKSAEDWPVSKEKIEQDFTNYLANQNIPHYVTDFVRKNQKHIDELHIPPF